MPAKKIKYLLAKFFELEYAGGVMMILSAALAMVFANSPLEGFYKDFKESNITVQMGLDFYAFDTAHFVKNGLMILFFFVVGLELKSEMTDGFLKKKSQIMLPLLAAIGGMVVPALIYCMVNEDRTGWAIPTATDIAFAVCILTIFGRKIIPPSARIFLLAVAIFDDLGAIIIIAAFFGGNFDVVALLAAALVALFTFRLDRITNPNLWHYLVLCALLSYLLHMAGIHPTIGGVITGLAVPLKDKSDGEPLLRKIMDKIHPLTTYFVLPLFAFVSAGISLAGVDSEMLQNPLPLGIILGLFAGKQIGIFGTTYLLVKTKLVHKPQGAGWEHIYAVSVLAGIGFTMSLFIGLLSFPSPEAVELVTFGVIAGSLLSTAYGVLVLKLIRKK